MLATPGDLPAGPGWIYEVKWDGMRLLADVRDGRVDCAPAAAVTSPPTSRSSRAWWNSRPTCCSTARWCCSNAASPASTRSPTACNPRPAPPGPSPTWSSTCCGSGVSLLDRPLAERRATLERLDTAAVATRALARLRRRPRVLAATVQRGMEGVVAKRRDGAYRPGPRSPESVKTTHRTQCRSPGRRLAAGERRDGAGERHPDRRPAARRARLLRAALRRARRAGLACDVAQRALRGRLLDVDQSPFAERLPDRTEKGARWCAPLTVVEVAHLGWTDAGRLRAPVYRGVRDDLVPDHVQQEM